MTVIQIKSQLTPKSYEWKCIVYLYVIFVFLTNRFIINASGALFQLHIISPENSLNKHFMNSDRKTFHEKVDNSKPQLEMILLHRNDIFYFKSQINKQSRVLSKVRVHEFSTFFVFS